MDISYQPESKLSLKIVGRHGDPMPRVQRVIDDIVSSNDTPQVLEAGCGSMSRVRLPTGAHLTGIDIAQRQLDNNQSLNVKILGDVQAHSWPPNSFDLIVSWDVIEHLNDPVKALDRLAESLKPDGGIVLAFPNIWSLKGIVTKFTPFWFHVMFYRHVIGDKRSVDKWDQFPTYLRSRIAPGSIRKWAKSNGLITTYDEVYEGSVQSHLRSKSRLMDFLFGGLALFSKTISAGRFDAGLSDCVIIIRRPA